MKKAALLFACTLLLYACGNNTGCRILNLDSGGYPEIPAFDISAYISGTEFLTLSGDSVVFTQTEKIYPGGKYILATRYNGILLFSREGKLLAKIAGEGRGPGEVSFVKEIRTDAKEEYLYCLDGNTNTLKKYHLPDGRYEKDIPLAREGTGSFDLLNDSVLICFPILNGWFGNRYLAYTQEMSGKLLGEIGHDPKPDNGPVYQGEAVLQKTAAGFLYMPYPIDTVFLVGNDLSVKPLLAVKKRREEGTLVSYRILFSQHESFILEITENQLKNEGGGNILMLAGKKEYFRINTEDENITRLANDTLAKLTFYSRGYCVLQSDPGTDVHHLNIGISTVKQQNT